MLSAIPRQILRSASTRSAQSINSLRYYSNKGDSGSDSNGADNGKATQEGEALLNILNEVSTPLTTQQQPGRNTTRGNSVALIMETLSRATDRQQQASSRPAGLLGSKLLRSGELSGRSFLGDAQPCSHNLHIHASMNNTILTLTDSNGDPITTQSAGSAGLKKSARSGPEAGYQAMAKMIEKVEEKNVHIQTLHVLMKGFGPGRDSAFKAIRAKTNWDIKRITDTTPIPFNGCRPPKARRL
ncbi:hypothetical protein B0O80DRAFT_418926 [Mortierella sp. GBAus27b]|nr:hypothetical protein BGX31_006129 [Mortierella sp. GBA43]KAI8347086.1 hypothetical protein B0O80DRAFT_418926 [Mortierella sp. GBAus27b]